MRSSLFHCFCRRYLVLCALLLACSGRAVAAEPTPSAGDGASDRILRVQLFLDEAGFNPGIIDGRWGEFTRKALSRYQRAQNGTEIGYGEQPPDDLNLPLVEDKRLTTVYRITEEDVQSLGSIPDEPKQQADLQALPYETMLELVAEKFHADSELVQKQNPGFDFAQAKAGDEVTVPNVARPFDVKEPRQLKKEAEEAEKKEESKKEPAASPKTSPTPTSEPLQIEIDTSTKMLDLRQAGKLIATYPITPGSDSLPAPKGEWKVVGIAWMPTFRWDEKMLQEGTRSENAYHLPPGPNSPVGTVWMELDKDGIGIHGTKAPETIGRTSSHGCIRLSNWDALDLGKRIKPGTPVRIF